MRSWPIPPTAEGLSVETETTRRLIWVPIVHSQEDLGRLRESVRRHHVHRRGEQAWDDHVQAVSGIWREIRQRLAALGLDPATVRLYQDGLPICGKEHAIVSDLAEAGSENHQLLAVLVAAGATLEGTESPALLLREYNLAIDTLNSGGLRDPRRASEFESLGRELLSQRDRFIAVRVNESLKPGETGVVFLGMLHNLDGHLAPDIRIELLDAVGAAR